MDKTKKSSREIWFIRISKHIREDEYGRGILGGGIVDFDYVYDRTRKEALCDTSSSGVVVKDRKRIKELEDKISKSETKKTNRVQRLNFSKEQIEVFDSLFPKAEEMRKQIRDAMLLSKKHEIECESAEEEMENTVQKEIKKVTRMVILGKREEPILVKK